MDLSRYVVLDCASGTFFNAAHAVLINVDMMLNDDVETLNEGSDADRCELADAYGIDLETWSPPDGKDSQALDAIARALDRQQWSPDHLETVAEIVRDADRPVRDNFHADAPSEPSPL